MCRVGGGRAQGAVTSRAQIALPGTVTAEPLKSAVSRMRCIIMANTYQFQRLTTK